LVTPNTRAVIPVHLDGQMCDIPALREMLDGHQRASRRIAVLEDCAHCFEGERDGVKPGTASDCAIFSFYATKNVTCGEGGAIITRDSALHARVLETRSHGMSAIAVDRFKAGRYRHWDMCRLGTKANLPDLLAALLPKQIERVDRLLPERWQLAARYRAAFANGPLRLVAQLQSCTSAEHLFTIGVPGGKRDQAIAALNEAGVGVTVNYRAVPETTYYKKLLPAASTNTSVARQWGGGETISLPLFPGLSEPELEQFIHTVIEKLYPLVR
jgi:UDP-4-amino-4-deoxy-L-arabinose-oxoglutarate aminotransferase